MMGDGGAILGRGALAFLSVSSKDDYGLMPLLAASESVKESTEKWGSDDIFYLTEVIRLCIPHLSRI